ncbi:aminoacyl-tRNA hydrolase [Candidatus Saccharibacteria bacterium]|nr:aminoacyl-tRNA hydrolase [Candidatus Saccharibacteria bacterium]
MNLIVALGNPGSEYNFTRHNFGFLALDFHFKINHLAWEPHPKFNAIWSIQGTTIFIKPQTFYNDIGLSVRTFADFYKIPPTHILAVCDDFNLPFGQLRTRQKGSAGGNNGLKSIIQHLGTENFPRLRLGTGNDALRAELGDVNFVLSKFTDTEKEKLPEVLKEASNSILETTKNL